jgi:hypothetical protein
LSSLAGQLLYISKINSKSNVECQRDRADYAESEKKKKHRQKSTLHGRLRPTCTHRAGKR